MLFGQQNARLKQVSCFFNTDATFNGEAGGTICANIVDWMLLMTKFC